MLTRETLIAEWERSKKETEALENLLSVKYGWTPTKRPEDQTPGLLASAIAANNKFYGGGEAVPIIKYAEEFRAWLKNQPGQFSIGDFRQYLEGKFGPSVNDNSIRTPLRLAEQDGSIVVVDQGAGRRPTTYVSAKALL